MMLGTVANEPCLLNLLVDIDNEFRARIPNYSSNHLCKSLEMGGEYYTIYLGPTAETYGEDYASLIRQIFARNAGRLGVLLNNP